MAQGLCLFDADRRLVICNQQYVDIYELPSELAQPGTQHEDIVNYRLAHGMRWDGGAEAFIRRNDARLAGSEVGIEIVELSNGRVVQVRHQPISVGGWVATHTDITDLRNREKELSLQNLRFDAAINNMSQGLSMFDGERRLVVSNARFAEIYGLPSEMLVPGTSVDILTGFLKNAPRGDGANAAGTIRALAEGAARGAEVVETADNRIVSILNQAIADGGWVSTHEDVTEQRNREARIRHLAAHDALTDLPNRTQFQEHIVKLQDRIRLGEMVAVLCVDLDHFKTINDTLGHSVGDGVLKAAAARLLHCCRQTDLVARLGGDEFAILQAPTPNVDTAAALARRIVQAAAQPLEILGHRIVIGASVGVAVAPNDGCDADSLMKNADLALYRAKSEGRGTFHFYEHGMDIALQKRLALEMGLRVALAHNELSLVYQPLVNLADNRISSFEALLRWNHPERGPIPPSEFVPIAEETGQIVAIGEWVLREACTAAAAWPEHIRIAVNLSPRQFGNKGLVTIVESALAASGLNPRRLELEVTESLLLIDSGSTLQILHRLRELGVRISMDDFGTGYSSLSYLRSFPFDKLKIDRSFVAESLSNPESLAIVKAVIGLGRSLGMETTAEGVETEAQLELIHAQGATEAQGFLISVPLPANAVASLLEATGSRHKDRFFASGYSRTGEKAG
ncbi:MAG: EAL domain-containing protein [Bauldia sp.]